jgi:glutaconate CoA-transferase subunit B
MAERFSVDELMCVLMAREIRDGDWVSHGAVVPLAGAALMLAKQTHAPNLDFFYLGTVFNSINPSETNLARLTQEPELAYRSSRALISHQDILSLTLRGHSQFQFLRPIQIDPYGNVNVSLVGSPDAPRYRFHGIAVADALVLVRRICLYVPEHDPRVFVEDLPFRTGTGHADGDRWRERIGAPGLGPVSVVTPLCVFDFETDDLRAQLRSLHPGVDVADVRARTGFEFHVPQTVPRSPEPTDEELRLLREVVDPLETRKLEFKEWRAEVQRRLDAGEETGR